MHIFMYNGCTTGPGAIYLEKCMTNNHQIWSLIIKVFIQELAVFLPLCHDHRTRCEAIVTIQSVWHTWKPYHVLRFCFMLWVARSLQVPVSRKMCAIKVDPYCIPSQELSDDVLPPVGCTDIFNWEIVFVLLNMTQYTMALGNTL